MGQKISELRGFMLTMDDEDASSEREGGQGASYLAAESKDGESDNGNVGEDQHFEAIYSTRNEPSTSSDELNGNSLHQGDCPASEPQCTCGQARIRGSRKRDEASGSLKRTARTVSIGSNKKSRPKRNKESTSGAKKRPHWGLRLNCARLKSEADLPDTPRDGCVCTGYRRTAEPPSPTALAASSHDGCACSGHRCAVELPPPAIDLARFNPDDFPIEDCDERARLERAREMAEGVEPPPGFSPGMPGFAPELSLDSLAVFFQTRLGLQPGVALSALSHIDTLPAFQRMHSQADFIHCLVPDLLEITSCSFYWGKMDRYEAERLLEGRPEGTFLLRDSAQEEHLFSVSFRKYGRSLHARIEQWNHRFSFDSHDPGVFASPTVVGLIEHYKDPSFCMFFEPMLTIPLHRTFTFPLQHLCRATVCSTTHYDAINRLPLPRPLKSYLREYHYKQRVRVRNLDSDL